MNIKILADRNVIIEDSNIAGVQGENNAEILHFDFPEKILNKNINEFKKYIKFDIENTGLKEIQDNKYTVKSKIANYGSVLAQVLIKTEDDIFRFKSKIFELIFKETILDDTEDDDPDAPEKKYVTIDDVFDSFDFIDGLEHRIEDEKYIVSGENFVLKEEGKSLIDDTEIERLEGLHNYDDTEIKQDITNLQNKDIEIDEKLDEKLNKSILNDVITDISLEHTESTNAISIKENKLNTKTGSETQETNNIPLASETDGGLMPKESFLQIIENTEKIKKLEEQGGRYIGISFKTYAELQAYEIPDTVNVGDFTFVLDDESRGLEDAPTTRYIVSLSDTGKKEFSFAYVISYDPIGNFTNTTAGLIKGSDEEGKVFAENDGTASVKGFDSLKAKVLDNEKNIGTINSTIGDIATILASVVGGGE